MKDNDLQGEINKLKSDYEALMQELNRIKDDNSRSLRRGVLSEAGATAEKILKFIYNKEGLDKNSKPSDKMMIDELLTEINRHSIIPIGIMIQFRTLQQWRNIGSHDKGDILSEVDQNAIITVNTSVAAIVNWFFNDYLSDELPEQFIPKFSNSNTTENFVISNEEHIKEYQEFYWWSMRTGTIKLLDQKTLDALKKKFDIQDADVNEIISNYSRKESLFIQILSEALEDKQIEKYELEAIEHSRTECCISKKEAQEILVKLNVKFTILDLDNGIDWISEKFIGPKDDVTETNINSDLNELTVEQKTESNSPINLHDIIEIVQRESKNTNIFWTPNIPDKKIKNAIKKYKIPSNEVIFSIVDTTVFGSADNGLAICETGIYLHNDWSAKSKGAFYFPWEKIIKERTNTDFKPNNDKTEVHIMLNIYLNISGCGSRMKTEDLHILFDRIIKAMKTQTNT